MTAKQTDSFGVEVNVGDYVYFRIKTRYGADALSMGRITKISDKGSLTLKAINTYGKTVEQYVAEQESYFAKRRAEFVAAGQPIPDYLAEPKITFNQRLASASSTVVVPQHVLSPGLIQSLQD